MKRNMTQAVCLAVISVAGIGVMSADAQSVRKLEGPHHVELTPEQQALLDAGSAYLEKGYKLLVEQNQPGLAQEQFEKALAIETKIGALKADSLAGGIVAGTYTQEAEKREQSKGALERLAEIESMTNVEFKEIANDLHARKLMEGAKEKAKKAADEQKQITQQLAQAGGGGTPDPQAQPPKPDAQQPKPDAQQPQKPEGQQPPQPNGQQQPQANGQQQPQPNGQQPPPPDGQQPPQPNGQQAAGGKPDPNQKPDPNAAPNNGALAEKQDQVAKNLENIANGIAQQPNAKAADRDAANAFRAAAAAATQTAEQIRKGDTSAAKANSQNTEKAIANALNKASAAGAETMQTAVRALQGKVEDLKEKQNANLTQVDDLKKAQAGGGGTPDQRAKANALAERQAGLKGEVEDVEKKLNELMQTPTDDKPGTRTAEGAAKENLTQANTALKDNKVKQETINATIDLRANDLKNAGESMAKVQKGLQDVHDQIAAAANALGAGDSQAKRDLENLQRISSGLRQLTNTAQTLATPTTQPGTDPTVGQPGSPPTALPPQMGKMLNASADKLQKELRTALADMKSEPMPGVGAASAAASKAPEFDKDAKRAVDDLRNLIKSVETVEAQLATAIDKEQQKAATKDFLKDSIPSSYQKRVSEYFDAIAKDQPK